MQDPLARTGADVDVGFIHGRGLGPTLVRRKCDDDADELALRSARPHAETLGREDAIGPTTDGDQTQETVRRNLLHQETNLIHVSRQDNARPLRFFGGCGEDATEAIGAQRAAAHFTDEDGANGVFVTGDAVGLGILFEE